jgi:hypothetical protein
MVNCFFFENQNVLFKICILYFFCFPSLFLNANQSVKTNLTNLVILQYVESVNGWSAGCEIQAVNSDITILETSIHHHQALYEGMCQAYTEVSSNSNYRY